MTFNKSKFVKRFFLPTLVLAAFLISCQDPWEKRVEINEDVPATNLLEAIMSRTELSEFAAAIVTTGWDTALSSTTPYTVWAPTNDAMALVSNEVKNNPDQLKDLVDNHIVFLQYKYYSGSADTRTKTFKEKYINIYFSEGKVEDAKLQEPYDIVANNGILHIIDKPLVPKINVWEFIESTKLCPKLTGYIRSMTGFVFDPTIATQIGVDPSSGKPIYDTASGMVWDNLFLNRTRNLRSEDTLSTIVLFPDTDYDSEYDKFYEYFSFDAEQLPDYELNPDSVTTWKICKDIVFEGAIMPNELPSVLSSTFGVDVPIGSFTIDSVFYASNGMVYIVNGYAIDKPAKIPIIIIEAEDTNKFVGMDPFGQTGYTREKPLASGGHDFVLDNHGGNPGSLTFHVPGLCHTKYNVYWVAVDDFDYSIRYPNPNDTITQSLGWVEFAGYEEDEPQFDDFKIIGTPTQLVDSTYESAQERFIYSNTIKGYQNKEYIQVRAEGKNRTISLDYIKLEPVFND